MSRQFIAGDGSDSTAAKDAYLAAHRELRVADLYVIQTAPKYTGEYLGKTFLLTNYPSPLLWSYKGTFLPSNISRGEVESKVGLEAATLEVEWSPQDSDVLSASPALTALQGFSSGVWDNGNFELWRVLMPEIGGSPIVPIPIGDCDTLGACMMFGGRIGECEPDRLKVKMTIVSRLETLNEMVPTNLIEPTNILAQYVTGMLAPTGPPSFSVVSGSTLTKVFADPTSGAATDNMYNAGYIVFGTGTKLGGTYRGVRQQTLESGHTAFYLYEPLPFLPTVTDTVLGYVPIPKEYVFGQVNANFAGFPFVPTPVNSTMGIY